MDALQKSVAEMAIRLLALPSGGAGGNPQELAEIERVATLVIREVAAARSAADAYLPGERSGMWRAVRLGR